MTRGVSYRQAEGMLIGGIALLAFAFALALYSTPSGVPGIPSFPFFSLPFPLLSLLLALSTAFIAWGWIFHPNGSFMQLMIASSIVIAIGLILKVVSFVTAIPLAIGSVTILVEPYGAQTTMVLVSGPLLALFGVMYYIFERFEKRKHTRQKLSGNH